MDIAHLYKLYNLYFLVDTDTRNIRKNTIFFALKGGNFNGNQFAEEALNNGAIYAIVDEEKYATSDSIILVDNVLKTLQQLANYHRKQLGVKIIGLTGSNGKTTTKELIKTVLSKKYQTTATIGNLNNHIGVPLTLLSMTPKTEIGIVEMGANHLEEISFLASIAEPDYGYITNFGKAHLEGFGSIKGVIQGKSELYDYLIASNNVIFVNPLDEIQLRKTENTKRVMFDSSIEFIEVNPFVKLSFDGLQIQSNLIGKYNFNNIAVSATVGKYFNISPEDVKNAIESYTPTNNRSQIIEKGTNKLILDAYNANPTSLTVALDNFNSIDAKQKIVIIGDMFELGKYSQQEHQKIVNLISEFNFDDVCLVGENFYNTITSFHKFKTYEDLKTYLETYQVDTATVLIKGSRGMKLERLLTIF